MVHIRLLFLRDVKEFNFVFNPGGIKMQIVHHCCLENRHHIIKCLILFTFFIKLNMLKKIFNNNTVALGMGLLTGVYIGQHFPDNYYYQIKEHIP